MDGLQGEREDPAQESANGLLVSSADVDCFEPIDIPLPVVNGKSSASKSQSSTGSLRGLLNPWDDFEKYAFPKQGPVCVCRDVVAFQSVMSVFIKFEFEANSLPEAHRKVVSEHMLKKMIEKLQRNQSNPAVFDDNFPLYVLLVARMHGRHTLYQCGDLDKFIETVLGRVESLPVEKVAEVLNGFLEQGDFKMMDDSDRTTNVSTFQNLFEACERILVLKSDKKQKRNMYCWILWITIAVRCQWDLSVHSYESQSTARILWNRYILNLKGKSSITLTIETIQRIARGVELGVLLFLPDELQLNASRMSSLLFPHDLIRPLQHIRNFIHEIKEFLHDEEQFVSSFVKESREHYDYLLFFKQTATPSKKRLFDASVNHTVSGFVEEGVEFLDTVWLISLQRQWNSDALKEECRKWFSLLLKAVEIKKGVESILGMLLASSKAVTFAKDCRPHIEAETIKKTREMFGKLNISVFYPLYKEFYIWSNEFLSDYLMNYTSHAELVDEHWALLFKEVVQRSPEPSTHGFILQYLSSEAYCYAVSSKPVIYILDLVKLDVPNLFIGPAFETATQSDTSVPGEKFKEHLHSYIASNDLQRELLKNVDVIMDQIGDQPHGFQDLILTVLQEDIVFHLQTSAKEKTVLRHLSTVINVLNKNVCPQSSLTRTERFCWGIVTKLCERIQPKGESFGWTESFATLVEKIGEIYCRYCLRWNIKCGTQQCILKEMKPDICTCPPEVQKYYLWIQQIHAIFFKWQAKFMQQAVNFNEITKYATSHNSICKVAEAVCALSLVIDDKYTREFKATYLQEFEELNILLLKYVPEVPRAKWCTLPSVLNMYGISIPKPLQEFMEQFVVFPGENTKPGRFTLQRHLLSPNTSGCFQPPQPISLLVDERLTLKEMATFIQDLKQFLNPIQDRMDMLIFFTLHNSILFSVYLQHELETRNVDVKAFQQALDQVKSLLVKLCHGEANYSQITADGAICLESLDILKEFGILLKCKQFGKLSGVDNTQGLNRVRNMADLLKISTRILVVRHVCQQYQLEGCLKDENLIKLTTIAEELMTEEARAALTPSSATEKMDIVRELLDTKGVVTRDYEYLAIFSKIADSAEFYQFIFEKGFTGENGQARFHQQYQLITAQLQHEEYDEAVLNLFYAAYKLILPFTEKSQSFHCLLESVKQLLTASPGDTVKTTRDCLMQIETVNRNINLIQLWFTRAEGDTLENVANDLKRIFQTGHYSFIIPENMTDSGKVELRYMPASKRAAKVLGVEKQSLAPEEEVSVKEETWDSEQTGAFARKLGFLDSEKAGGELVKPFLHSNEVANKLLDFLLKLREMGYPSHLTDVARNGLRCNDKEADLIVKQMEHTMDEWSQNIDRLLLKHHWLLLFSLPKLLKLSQLLRSAFQPDYDAKKIMHEIGFLFCSQMEARKQVLKAIKDSLTTLRTTICIFDQNEASFPLKVCGIFVDALFKHSEIAVYCAQKNSGEDCLKHLTRTCWPKLYSTHRIDVLHSAPDFSREELISLVTKIYDGRLPWPFEFFRCHKNTTMHQLKLFITRANNHPLTFVILGVNLLPIKLQEMLLRQHVDSHSYNDQNIQSCIHYVETLPSVLQEMPWVHQVKHKLSDIAGLKEEVQEICRRQAIVERELECVKVVYGAAGCGKSHFIKQQMKKCSCSVTVAVNEGFEPQKAIKRLHLLPKDKRNCAIFFNFHLIPPVGDSVSTEDRRKYDATMEMISWFFFDLLFLGYVEDSHSGESFHLPGGLSWSIYVEVPSRNLSSNVFLEDFISEIPIFKLLGTPTLVESTTQYSDVSNPDVQLVCKYLKAYDNGGEKGIDKLYKEGKKRPVKFSTVADLSSDECERLLMKYIPPSIRKTKTSQLLFLRYMRRRCWFLDNLPAYNYNTGVGIKRESGEITDTKHLGSILIAAMIKEAEQFCHPSSEASRDYHQLIYDVQDGGGSIGLLSTAPDKWTHLKHMGVDIPTMLELHRREFLDRCISRALNIPLEGERLTAIDEENYVLTLDFTIKMLQIHERYECGEPVILQGETGVGKTALIQMLSKLWNTSLAMELKRLKRRLLEFLHITLKYGSTTDQYEVWLQVVISMISGEKISFEEEDLMYIAMLPFANSCGHFYQEMKDYLLKLIGDPVLPLLEISCEEHFEMLFNEAIADTENHHDYAPEENAKPVVKVFHALLTATVKSTFHKLNVHAAMKPADLSKELESVFEQARQLQKANEEASASFLRVPYVTIFLDELNASTCGGLLKELILDKTFQGEPIPQNIFIVAACNPHRGNSMASLSVANADKIRVINENSAETWIMDSYFVRRLHPTLAHLMWDYGSLGEDQERQYVLSKVNMQSNLLSETQKSILTELIVYSQNLMRKYAFEELSSKLTKPEAKVSSKCCVSQRDIQRVFTFYEWTLKLYRKLNPHNDPDGFTSSLRAIHVALGTVYYMRLSRKYRARYKNDLALKYSLTALQFSDAFQSELDWYTQQIELPKGIAKTQALKENIFGIIMCSVTQTPLIIVGAPGSSKTLSFNIVVSTLKGQESKNKIFRETDVFCSLDPHFYQCSRRTTSNEVRTVFSRAITRQKNIAQFSLPIKCVVFMDEAGLPEHSHESLKILHSYLDNPKVSFVAISNTVLDASKTNRAITLFRDPTELPEDLEVLATECLFESAGCPPHNLKEHVDTIIHLHSAYTEAMTELKLSKFFGLRDFIHFVQYIRYKCEQRGADLSLHQVGQLVTESLERNFSGSQQFSEICVTFLHWINMSTSDVRKRDTVQILKESLRDAPTIQDEVRYKIIIHSSEDDSLVRLLFQFKVLERQNTRIYMCSDFPGDSELQKIDTIAGIRHSAIEGHAIMMLQTDDIHESFYDLFNRRFKRIDDPVTGTRLYANIAIGAHLKPCRVDPKFQCVVTIKKSELDHTPAPFLNRFEKYYITHKDMYESVLKCLPIGFKLVVKAAYEKVQEFVHCSGGPSSFYGFSEATLDSLLLKVLPVEFNPTQFGACEPALKSYNYMSLSDYENGREKHIHIVQLLTEALQANFNFHFQQCSVEELEYDADYLLQLVQSSNSKLEGIMQTELKDIETARKAVHSALESLHKDHIDFTQPLPPVTQLVQSLLVQWLVRHFCKGLMQLMTPEALVLHENQIPATYIHNYLTYQKHFSLKDLIQQQLDRISVQEKRSNTKLLCFTRTSPLIHNLPSVYPSTAHSPSENADHEIHLTNYVFCHVLQLVVCKIEGAQSQQSVKTMVMDFMRSDKEVMFLLANMQEVSKSTVNHLRVMIEEEEAFAKEYFKPKLFVILLHFPPAMFYISCYPSLFLEGWDHYYLDTIAHGFSHGIVDSVEWLHMSFFPIEQDYLSTISDTFFIVLKHLLPQSVPHVVSRLSFGSDRSRPFNQKMTPLARSEMLQRLFDTEIGDALCHQFRSYWKAEVMTEYLHRAVKFTQMGQTTLNITDSIHSIMKSHFLDFVVYMVDYMNDNYNLDIFFSLQTTDKVKQLFLDLTGCLPIPQKLSKLKIMSNIQHGLQKAVSGKYRFPYFGVVCAQIMDIVKEVAHRLCQSENFGYCNFVFLPERRVGYQFDFEQQLKFQVENLLFQIEDHKGCVAVAVNSISNHREIWERYFHDFAREQLSLWEHNEQVVEETVKAAFGTVCTPSASNISQLTSLHVYTHLNQLNIVKSGAAIGPLLKLSSITQHLSQLSSNSSAIFLKTEDMNTFVVNTLFSAVLNASAKHQTSGNSIELWYNAYHVMIHSLDVRKHIYSALSATSEAKLNVMHAAFLAVQYDPSDKSRLMMCQAMLNSLCKEHFIMPSFELKGSCPQMPEIFKAVVEGFGHVQQTDVSDSIMLFIADGLLTHFICYYDKPNKVNIEWLLEHINEQKNWLKIFKPPDDSDKVQTTDFSDVHCVPLNALKYYLLKILGSCRKESGKQFVSPFELEGRAVVETFLSQKVSSGVTRTYIPPFYQLSGMATSKDGLHSQPLAYLYFLAVFEHLLNQQSDLFGLLNAVSELHEIGSDEKTLHCIEKQALVQVIIRELAKHLLPENYKATACNLSNLQMHLNALIDERTSGGRIQVHGDILAMHLLNETKNLERFTRLLTEQYDTHCAGYKCLNRFNGIIKEPYSCRTNFYHLLLEEDRSSSLGKLYRQVQKLVVDIVDKGSKPKQLIDLATKSQRSQVSVPDSTGSSDWIEKLPCVRMMIWLSVYHHIYNQQRQSTEMTGACSKLPPTLFDVPYCQLIRWFASLKDSAMPGPLSELFGQSATDPTDVCLRHSLANLVACAIGTCDSGKASHLWHLLFAPEKLKGTYFAGYMVGGPVNAEEGKPYEAEKQLSKDRLCHLLQPSTRKYLNLNSCCMLLWINVAAFCLSLLTQEGETLSGILSSGVPVERYCVSQLHHLWMFMRNNMQLIDEELSYLVMMCMRRYLQTWVASPEKMSGIFTNERKVADYEQIWHTDVFMPCLEKLGREFIKNLKDPLKTLLVEIRQVEAHYPHFPADTAALYSVLSLPGVQTQSRDKLVVLSKFISKQSEVEGTLPLLTDFMEFYQWLHKDLAGLLTPEKADKLSIKKLVDQMSRHYSGESGRKMMSLYQRVKCGYNHYVKDAVGMTPDGEFDKICVRSFLTLDASTLAGNLEGDILYSIIYEMVSCHNDLLDCIQTISSQSKDTNMHRYIPGSIPSVLPSGVTENTCITGRSEGDKIELVSRRHQTSMATHNQSDHVVANWHLLTFEDLLKLQEDVVSLYLSGRPKIRNIASLHIPYAFRASKPTSKAHPLNFAQDLNQVGKCLPPILKSNFTKNHIVLQLLECEFHSADYHAMLDVVTGLKTAIALLEKRVQETDSDGTNIHELTLKTFLCSEEDSLHQAPEIFEEKRLSERQMSTVMQLPLSTLYYTFTTFIQWVAEGRYDFRMLPYALKAHLCPKDVEQLKKIQSLYKNGSEPMELLMEVKLLSEVLDHLESNLIVVGTQVPLVDYLTPMVIFEGHDEFLGLIPRTILIQHYMSLRILLKQLTAELQKDSPKPEGEMERPWYELVTSLTETTAKVCETLGDYGFKHGYESDTESVKVKTSSCATQFGLSQEDELDEFHNSQPSGLEAEKGNGNQSAKTPVHETTADALQEAHLLKLAATEPETDKKQLLQLARQYSSEAVGNFITSIGYSNYAEQFEENDFSGDALIESTDEHLKDLGIESALARLKIIILFRRQLQGLHSLAKNYPADKVVEFLDGLKPQEKEQYKRSFDENEIDGEMLLAMEGKHDVMIELGVQRPAHRLMILSKFKTLIEKQGQCHPNA